MMRTRRILTAVAATIVLATIGLLATIALGAGPSVTAADDEKVLYLTFDDGPGDETAEILELLREYDAKAVFFALGRRLAANTDTGSRILAEGHALANHTWNHPDLTSLDEHERDEELHRTAELLDALGADSPCVRPPHGSTNDEVRDDLRVRGLQQVLWNVDTEDWTDASVDTVVDRLLDADSGDVVLLHDGGGDRTKTVTALRRALPKLAAEGYRFEIVPGC